MTILWLLFLPGVFSQKLSPQENYRLKQECGDRWLQMPQRARRSAEKFIAIGSGVPPGELPFVAGLAIRSEMRRFLYNQVQTLKYGTEAFCTGVQISPRHILTAAHCLFDISVEKHFDKKSQRLICELKAPVVEKDVSKLVFVLGSRCDHNNTGCWMSEPYYRIKQKYIHPRYNYCIDTYDLGLVELEHDISSEHGKPICMPDAQESISMPLMAAGYGYLPTRTESLSLQRVWYDQYQDGDSVIFAQSAHQSLCPVGDRMKYTTITIHAAPAVMKSPLKLLL
ncbi:trypsin, partial [Ancylostoma caninum]